MTEQEAKFLCKWAIENGQRQLTPAEKELLKKGIDDAKSFQDFLAVALAAMAVSLSLHKNGYNGCLTNTQKCLLTWLS